MKHNKYDKTERKRIGIILSAFLVLFAIIASIYIYFYLDEKNVPEYLDITISGGKVVNVAYTQMQDESVEKVNISWQSDSAGVGRYLFLPSFADCDDVMVRVHAEDMDSYAEITLGKVKEDAGVETEDAAAPRTLADCTEKNIISEEKGYFWKNMGTGDFVIDAYGTEVAFAVYSSENVPCLWLTLDNESGLEYIEADKANVTTANVVITTEDGQIDYSGEVEQFKGHGNSSWARQKRSYKMYLQQKNSLLGMDKCKKWILVSNVVDRSSIRNMLFTDMAKACGLQNTMDCEWVDLYVDGEYRGLYLLSEKIDINSENFDIGDLEKETEELNDEPLDSFEPYQRVDGNFSMQGWNIPEEPQNFRGGYIIEADYLERFDGEPSRFCTNQEEFFVVKSPEYATANQIEYIAGFVQQFEDAVVSADGMNAMGLHYSTYIDMESFAKRYVLDEISKNIDSGYSSYYCYKPEKENKLYAGPIWDYDTALGNNNGWGDAETLTNPEGFYVNQHNWAELLYNQPEFYEQTLYEYGRYFEPYLQKAVDDTIEEYIKEIDAAADMNGVLWGVPDWEENALEMKAFLEARMEFLNSQWKK